jgi:trypsin
MAADREPVATRSFVNEGRSAMTIRPRLRRCAASTAALVAALLCAPLAGPAHAVYRGYRASTTSFPWAVAVVGSTQTCTGTLIARAKVLTAAHCVDVGTMTVIFHSDDPRKRYSVQVRPPAAVPPTYLGPTSTTARDDIAVLTLVHAAKDTPVQLSQTEPPVGTQLTGVGYGCTLALSDSGSCPGFTLRYLNAYAPRAMTDSACADPDPRFRYAPTTELCVTAGASSINYGDSGGPLLWQRSGTWYVVGVASGGLRKPQPPSWRAPYMNGYTSVPVEMTWLSPAMR